MYLCGLARLLHAALPVVAVTGQQLGVGFGKHLQVRGCLSLPRLLMNFTFTGSLPYTFKNASTAHILGKAVLLSAAAVNGAVAYIGGIGVASPTRSGVYRLHIIMVVKAEGLIALALYLGIDDGLPRGHLLRLCPMPRRDCFTSFTMS